LEWRNVENPVFSGAGISGASYRMMSEDQLKNFSFLKFETLNLGKKGAETG
jgi:hypothetical protein